MKEQNPDIPFVVQQSHGMGRIFLDSDELLDKLILDPRGILSNKQGAYVYICKRIVTNAARVLRDQRKLSRNPKPNLVLQFAPACGNGIDSELGKAIEAMAEEIKALEKERK